MKKFNKKEVNKKEEIKRKCSNCLEGRKLENEKDKVYCFVWEIVVQRSRAEMCPQFTPKRRQDRDRRDRRDRKRR